MFPSKNPRAVSLITVQGKPMEDNVEADDGGGRKMLCVFPDEAITGKRNKISPNL